ncbi:SDR family oxidoreductase [Micromonospora sp. NPDC000212]|uniref:SDR family oxidoreductase n=1 Tax=Micromonospora sp. NPDC000212 TaxID=3364215 RepID=UPI0036790B57
MADVGRAVDGVDAILHLASQPGGGARTHRVDMLATRRLALAAGHAGVGQLVYVSTVGVDRVPLAYYRHKLAAERVVAAGPAPWTVLRATQLGLADGPPRLPPPAAGTHARPARARAAGRRADHHGHPDRGAYLGGLAGRHVRGNRPKMRRPPVHVRPTVAPC